MVAAMEPSSSPPSTLPSLPVAPVRIDVLAPAARRLQRGVVHGRALAHLHTKTCPQCGIGEARVAVDDELTQVPPWVYVLAFFNVIAMAVMALALRRSAHARYRLCVECAAARRRARIIRFMGVVSVLLLPLLAGAIAWGVWPTAMSLLLGTLTGTVSGFVAAFAAHHHTRLDVVTAKGIDRRRDLIELQAPDSFYKVVVDEAPQAIAAPPKS